MVLPASKSLVGDTKANSPSGFYMVSISSLDEELKWDIEMLELLEFMRELMK